jgi:cyanophycin synthetase
MRIESSRRLRGPNRFLDRPVQVSRVHLEELTELDSTPLVADALVAMLPGLAEHYCAAGRPGGFRDRLYGGTYYGHIAEHLAIEMSNRIGRTVNFGRTTYAGAPGVYDVMTECPTDEPIDSYVAEDLLRLAVDLVTGLRMTDAHRERLDEIRVRFERERPGPSTAAIAEAAERRGIPVERVGALSLLRLGHGRHRRLVWAAMTDQTSAVGVDIASDKELTRELLSEAGIPVPRGGAASTRDAALELFGQLPHPVVVKPRGGRQGQHVYLGIDTAEALFTAFDAATADGGDAVVEEQLAGRDFRVLMIGGRLIAAAERVAAHVVGDGRTDLAGLIERANEDPRRGLGHDRPLTRLTVDDVTTAILRREGITERTVPPEGRLVWLRDNANLSTGGTSVDVTDRVHPDVAALCGRVAAIVGLDVAGIDLRLTDVDRPAAGAGTRGGIIEVNAAPGLRMHLAPSGGAGRDAGAAIVEALYPAGSPSRVPTVAITGTNGKTTVARLTAHLLSGAGLRVGVTTTDGVFVGGRLVQEADATGPRSAQVVLGDPTIDAAVLETARGGLLRQGLGYDWSDVGVITNITADHLGQDGIDDIADLVGVKSVIAERVREGGALVLNADDACTRAIELPGRRVIWFSLDPRNPIVRQHWDAGGRAYLLADGWLVELADRRWVPLLAVTDLAGSFGGAARHAVANALAAVAAARELGVTTGQVAERLRGFTDNPGRGSLYRVGDVEILVDYAHNPAALEAVGDLIDRVWGAERAVAVVTLPGDRRDDLLRESARAVADRFGRIVLYEDNDRRGRAPGEVPGLVRAEIRGYRAAADCTVVSTVEEALRAALDLADPGDVVLLLYEKIGPVLALLESLGGRPARAGTPERQLELLV